MTTGSPVLRPGWDGRRIRVSSPVPSATVSAGLLLGLSVPRDGPRGSPSSLTSKRVITTRAGAWPDGDDNIW